MKTGITKSLSVGIAYSDIEDHNSIDALMSRADTLPMQVNLKKALFAYS